MLNGISRLAPVPAAFLQEYGVVPVRRDGAFVEVATWLDAPDPTALDDLALLLNGTPRLVGAPQDIVLAAIRRHYAGASGAIDSGTELSSGPTHLASTHDLLALANEPPVIQYVNLLLADAVEARASDVHLELAGHDARVRVRVDGLLHDADPPPEAHAAAVISRLKVMADLDIAERRAPQDGRLRMRLGHKQLDVRVATMPLLNGESVVLRILDPESSRLPLEELGMQPAMMDSLLRAVSRTQGMVLITGPTGSGKTTTLYALLEKLHTGREKIVTLEDPIEYQVSGVCQIPVNTRAGLTFSAALRSVLRQDPDVILVGEVRDTETAVLATQAALTGHLVLATLHTADPVGALTRLLDLGVPSYLVASTVDAVLAQRLVRRVCVECRGTSAASRSACLICRGSGWRGRTGFYELLELNERIREAVQRVSSASALRTLARAGAYTSLREDGERHVRAGLTTTAELERVLVSS